MNGQVAGKGVVDSTGWMSEFWTEVLPCVVKCTGLSPHLRLPCNGCGVPVDGLGNAKVDELQLALNQQEVGRLQVTVYNALLMHTCHSLHTATHPTQNHQPCQQKMASETVQLMHAVLTQPSMTSRGDRPA